MACATEPTRNENMHNIGCGMRVGGLCGNSGHTERERERERTQNVFRGGKFKAQNTRREGRINVFFLFRYRL